MSVPQYQSQQTNILPEQLVYLHNQAYATQAVNMPTLTSGQQLIAQNQPPQTYQQLNENLDLARKPQKQSSSVGSNRLASKSNEQARRDTTGSRQQFDLLDASKLNAASTSSTTQQIPTSTSLFLPYLQSEAARRLQLQRSRSSERDNKSNSDNQQSTSHSGASGDKNQSQERVITHQHGSAEMSTKKTERRAPATVMTKKRESPASGAGKSKTPFWRLFRSSKSTNTDRSHDQTSQSAAHSTLLSHCARSGSQSTSSSTSGCHEDEYLHHRHFQARASICSNNLWRIGPTRRCSLAVPVNYPTYYRPLAQLQHHRSNQAISSISGSFNRPIGHYHEHDKESFDSSESPSSLQHEGMHNSSTVGALVSAANSLARPGHSTQSQTKTSTGMLTDMGPITSGGFIRVSGQLQFGNKAVPPRPAASPFSRVQSNSASMPTPPPPLPPEFDEPPTRINERQEMRNPHLRPPWAGQPPSASYHATIERMVAVAPAPQLYHQRSQGARVAPSLYQLPQQVAHFSGQMKNPNYSGHTTTSLSRGPSISGMSDTLHRTPRQPTRVQHLILPPSGSAQTHHFMGSHTMLSQLKPRSRSTDQRLPSMGANSGMTYLPNNHLGQQPIYHLGQQPVGYITACQGQQSIGRALGQAYMQRLQRQPTIYSLHSNQRDFNVASNLHMGREPSCHEVQIPSIDMMRRSKSQTSLSRRAQHSFSGMDCDQCTLDSELRHTMATEACQLDAAHDGRHQMRPRSEMRGHFNINNISNGSLKRVPRGSKVHCARACSECSGQDCITTTTTLVGSQCQGPSEKANCRCEPGQQQQLNHVQTLGLTSTHRHSQPTKQPMTALGVMKLISEVDKAIQNAMFIAQHIDNLDEFESVST